MEFKTDEVVTALDLWANLPSIEAEVSPRTLEQKLEETQIDFDVSVKRRLIETILRIDKAQIMPVDDDYTVRVHLKDESVYAFSPRRFAHCEKLQIRNIVDDLLSRGIIKPSVSPYCARVIPVRKKNGLVRMCIDLRPLNSRVTKQKYPFPRIEDCLSRLTNKTIFTLLDLKDGFHQIRVHSDCTKYFSFATPEGQFEYNYLPFGYSEAPAEFQKRILQVLDKLIRDEKVIVYMDDLLIASVSVEQNLTIIKEVLYRLREYGFEINYSKCQFLKRKIEFLGYIISGEGITLSVRHTEAIRQYRQPENVHEVQRFLGLVNYFRRFIKNCAIKVEPIRELLRKDIPFDFDKRCVEAFETIKLELTRSPILAIYDPSAETELHTDASQTGLGAILLQKGKNHKWSVVAYFSQTTNKAERNYHSFELEMLAVVRAIERFHLYLYGLNFTVVSDCQALVYAVTKANLNPRIARWTLALQTYKFKLVHRSSEKMRHVDALSRCVALISELPLERELEFRQLADSRIKEIAYELEFNDNDKFVIVDGLVYRKVDDCLKFVVPDSMISNVVRAYHDNMAHVGYEKTYRGIITSYWFPHMRKRIKQHIENCITCLTANESPNRFEGETSLYPLPTAAMQQLHIDHFGPLTETTEGYKYILVVVDAFSRFTWLTPSRSTTSREGIIALRNIFATFGNPNEIVSDRGTAFTSQEFAEFANRYGIKHRKVAVAAPWANGMVERVNRFIKNSLIKMTDEPTRWETQLFDLQYIVNNTYHATIKTTPSMMIFGYDQRNHEDSSLRRLVQQLISIDEDNQTQRNNVTKLALRATEKIRAYNKVYRDYHHRKPSMYSAGDYVMIRNTKRKPGTSGKLKPNYKGPYVIDKTLGNNRYVVKDIPGFNLTLRPMNTILSSDRIKKWVKATQPPNPG